MKDVGGFSFNPFFLLPFILPISRLHDADLGYVLIVDRRSDRWNAVKATLLRLSVRCGAIVIPLKALVSFVAFFPSAISTVHSLIHVPLTFSLFLAMCVNPELCVIVIWSILRPSFCLLLSVFQIFTNTSSILIVLHHRFGHTQKIYPGNFVPI